ncbi:MAG: helix-turn-helix transcriptional regulator [Sulfurimonas sp.]|uniref:helix-turn-helix domain-containing protein n=1 Tax=Sulfurimonas sp. TaxID=2022749 RepID=UPI0028CBC70A|nr:helix-turn-helix transcriptional regulator [Sulfurimonas sp.]MDT8338553.1 helix-turn-helix transcriptional regulator [Sulfurimonas sp.]
MIELEYVRLHSKMNKQTFAKEIGICPNSYSVYIKDKNTLPAPVAIRIMQKYHVNLNWLLCGVGVMKLTDSEISQLKISNGGE